MTIDEFIELLKNGGYLTNREEKQIANWLEELKVIKEIDLSIPQHFTKEQSDWIKKYCINRNKEFYNKALDDFVGRLIEELSHTTLLKDGYYLANIIKPLAEQLKEQEK